MQARPSRCVPATASLNDELATLTVSDILANRELTPEAQAALVITVINITTAVAQAEAKDALHEAQLQVASAEAEAAEAKAKAMDALAAARLAKSAVSKELAAAQAALDELQRKYDKLMIERDELALVVAKLTVRGLIGGPCPWLQPTQVFGEIYFCACILGACLCFNFQQASLSLG